MTKGEKMLAIKILSFLYFNAFIIFILVKLNALINVVGKIHARIDEHAKISEAAHKMNLDEKKKNGR